MNITFPPIDEQYIKDMVKKGYYSNATEMVRDCVRRRREQEPHHARLSAAIQKGLDDGEVIEYSAKLPEAIWAEAKRRHRKNPQRRLDKDVTGEA